jgi:hypothetical protein
MYKSESAKTGGQPGAAGQEGGRPEGGQPSGEHVVDAEVVDEKEKGKE